MTTKATTNPPELTTAKQEWDSMPKWMKRVSGFSSYLVYAVFSIFDPEAADKIMVKNLVAQFEEHIPKALAKEIALDEYAYWKAASMTDPDCMSLSGMGASANILMALVQGSKIVRTNEHEHHIARILRAKAKLDADAAELKNYREGGVTEEILRKTPDGAIKVGKGCMLVQTAEWEDITGALEKIDHICSNTHAEFRDDEIWRLAKREKADG